MNAAIGVLSVLESEAKAINGFRRDLGKWLARMEETNWDVTGSTGPDELTLADLNHTVIRLREARATVKRLAEACERLQKGHPHLAGVYGVTAALAAFRGDA